MGVWAASLKGITPEMIKTGLNKLITRGYDWPPSAPEFSKLCRPSIEDFDVPSFDDAINHIGILSRRKDHRIEPFVYTMYLRVGKRMYDLNRMSERDYRAEMKRYYDEVVKVVLSGGDLDVQPMLIEEAKKEYKPMEDSAEKFQQLKKAIDGEDTRSIPGATGPAD